MIDFVHLNWISYKKEKPKTDGIYIYLLRDRKTGKSFVMSIGYFDEALMGAVYWEKFEIIAWADAEMVTFDCNPERLHTCNDKECRASNDCSTCTLTTNIEDAKWISWFR